jgi:hypothetical protein
MVKKKKKITIFSLFFKPLAPTISEKKLILTKKKKIFN